MYKEFFGFKEPPFSIAPDPRFLYMSERHREALAHLFYGIGSDGGFVLLTGEIGAGKTTICRCLLEKSPPDAEIAFILNPKVTALELLQTICDEFKISVPETEGSIKGYVDRLNAFLLDVHARGRRAILIIDEAQNLDPEVLEQIRLLTNLETDQRKLLQILLLGQPELRDILQRPELRQLAQRITARYHLEPLSRKETAAYIVHRLAVAGVRRTLFPPSLMGKIHRKTWGVPRLVNILCDRALMGAYSLDRERVSRFILGEAVREIEGSVGQVGRSKNSRAPFLPIVGVALATLLIGAIAWLQPGNPVSVDLPDAPDLIETTSAEAQPPPAPANPDLSPDLKGTGSKGEAFQALFSRWGLSYQGGEKTACEFAEENGLQCLFRQGNLASLRHFNRPAVLRLMNQEGEAFFATLVALEGNNAVFARGEGKLEVPVDGLGDLWRGEYVLLWRPPPEYAGTIHPGEGGKGVEWLARQAEAIKASPGVGARKVLTGELLDWVVDFQKTHMLNPDGLVGPHTLIQINSRTGLDVPRLVPVRKGE